MTPSLSAFAIPADYLYTVVQSGHSSCVAAENNHMVAVLDKALGKRLSNESGSPGDDDLHYRAPLLCLLFRQIPGKRVSLPTSPMCARRRNTSKSWASMSSRMARYSVEAAA